MATAANFGYMLLGSAVLCMAVLAAPIERSRAQGVGLDAEFELVDPKVLRVCADPSNLPFSNEKGEGFENKLAELLAAKLGKALAFVGYPQATGFVRNTLGAHRCDLIPGFPQGDELVQSTNPYYRTAYALVVRPGTELDDLDRLTDPRLKEKPYPLVIDTRVDSSAQAMMRDLASGEIDVGVLWGPMAGYYAKQANPPMRVVLLLKETGGPPLAFRIAMGVRAADQNWKRQLNKLIAENQADINRLLRGFG